MVPTTPIKVTQTLVFREWLQDLRDRRAAAVIGSRIVRVQAGLTGDIQPIRDGLHELRVDVGAGYRLYCVWTAPNVLVLLLGSNKQGQRRAINAALHMLKG